jgi:precorrin-8X/cobalt-precorrin-8 methylmutase
MAAARHPEGAVVVVGCAPTALAQVVRLAAQGRLRPALVVGLPVGFVGAAEAKEELRASRLPSISNVGEKGGSGAAAAVVNALARLAATS